MKRKERKGKERKGKERKRKQEKKRKGKKKRGLRPQARALEVRFQGEDWGWLHEHSLKGASAPQLAGRESVEKSGPA